MGRDRWAEWILNRRFGGDAEAAAASLEGLAKVRDRVLDRADLRAGETVLDVGCGDGLIALGALERGAGRVIFSDVSEDLLDVCRELAAGDPRAEFVRARAEDLAGIADASVDVATTRSVLIYVADKARAFAEFRRVLKPGGRLSVFEPINSFGHPEPDGRWLGIDVGELWPLASRVRDRFDAMAGDASAMLDFDERDLLALAHAARFESVDVALEARIERGRLWGREPPPFERLLKTAPNPNAPTLEEVLDTELDADERERFLAYVRPRYEAGEMTGRSALAYLRARVSRTEPKRRVPVGDEEERVGPDAVRPTTHADDEVEQAAWVAPREEDREPREDHREDRAQPEKHEHDVVRDREEPLHERQPPVELVPGIRVREVERDRLMLVRRGIAVVEQREVCPHPVLESGQLEVPVEPPPRILLPEEDHQERPEEQRAAGADRDRGGMLAGRLHRLTAANRLDDGQDRDRDDEPESRPHAVEIAVRVLDGELHRIRRLTGSLLGRFHGSNLLRSGWQKRRFSNAPVAKEGASGRVRWVSGKRRAKPRSWPRRSSSATPS
jgi:SAM-dependent methyltransferase